MLKYKFIWRSGSTIFHFPYNFWVRYIEKMRRLTISAACSRSSQAIILNPLAAISALASSTRVPGERTEDCKIITMQVYVGVFVKLALKTFNLMFKKLKKNCPNICGSSSLDLPLIKTGNGIEELRQKLP